MNRRDALRAIAAGSAGIGAGACVSGPSSAPDRPTAELQTAVRNLTGLDLPAEHAAATRELLERMRFVLTVDPHVPPAVIFDPEVPGE